jgi:hypothetical protein
MYFLTFIPAIFDDEMSQWEETNRREKWDRSYEKRLRMCRMQPDSTAALDALQAEYVREHANRRDWDSKYQQPLNSSSSSVPVSSTDISTSTPDTGSPAGGPVGSPTSPAGKERGLKREALRKFLGKRG